MSLLLLIGLRHLKLCTQRVCASPSPAGCIPPTPRAPRVAVLRGAAGWGLPLGCQLFRTGGKPEQFIKFHPAKISGEEVQHKRHLCYRALLGRARWTYLQPSAPQLQLLQRFTPTNSNPKFRNNYQKETNPSRRWVSSQKGGSAARDSCPQCASHPSSHWGYSLLPVIRGKRGLLHEAA